MTEADALGQFCLCVGSHGAQCGGWNGSKVEEEVEQHAREVQEPSLVFL